MSDANSSSPLRSIDDLEASILNLCARINATTYQLLVEVREFDRRAGWVSYGLSSCAEWLACYCPFGLSAAREKVRVAHALATLPVMSEAFGSGRLSYSKARALTRVAGSHNEAELVEFALRHSNDQVEQRCRELRCGTIASVNDAMLAQARRSLSMYRDHDKGTMKITIELPMEQGELIDKALDKARDDNPAPEFRDESWSARQADALVAMARDYLNGTGSSEEKTDSADNYLVTVHVGREALAKGRGRAGLPLESVKRLCCGGHTVTIVENAKGEPLNIGRKSRTIPTAIQRALRARDRHCRFPGCTNSRFVNGHHIEHWSNGGETSLDNLILLCEKHHRLVHEGGFRIDKDYRDRWTFFRPDGIAVPESGYHLSDIIDETVVEVSDVNKYPSREGFKATREKAALNVLQREFRDRTRLQSSYR